MQGMRWTPIVATGVVGGSTTIPADIHTIGWYDGIDTTTSSPDSSAADTPPVPGQPGVALLAGHVDWAGEGPGALYYLGQLQVGDPIGANGTTTQWQVTQAPITIAKGDLPADLFVNTGPAKLTLVTCGAPFDAATGHYLGNVIVWASPTG
jgi:sortase (surface protein transpeptidase)